MKKKKIVFLTGTRADFGKMGPLMKRIDDSREFECHIFATGMHLLRRYGFTVDEIRKRGYKNIHSFVNQKYGERMDEILANTIKGFSDYINELKPDMVVVHGDRLESLAGAIAGSFNNILVGHVEGGEVSGTIDELIRHSISKLSHIHFASNKFAKRRLVQMGEKKENIFIIGSPDIDVIKSKNLPSLKEAKKRYGISFEEYAIFIYHPVTTELEILQKNIGECIAALKQSKKKYVIVYPNNDQGSEIIFNETKKLKGSKYFNVFPSLRFGHFLSLLANAEFIIGNSSTGIREAPALCVPTINIGSRQNGRTSNKSIINVKEDKGEILKAIAKAKSLKLQQINEFGTGNSAEKFYKTISKSSVWKISPQKKFNDLEFGLKQD